MSAESPVPILCRWEGDAFQVLDRFRGKADQQYVVGEVYLVEAQLPRSKASHSHYFARIHELWQNLPETYGDQFPTADHLRKYALIKCGYFNEKSLVCSTRAEALRLSSFIKPLDEFAVVITKDRTIKVFTAKSQREVAMDRKEFQTSKEAVLGFLEDLVGVTKQESSHGPELSARRE